MGVGGKNLVVVGSLLGGGRFFLVGWRMSKFSASGGGGGVPHPPSKENPDKHKCNFHYAAMSIMMSQILESEFMNYTSQAKLWQKLVLDQSFISFIFRIFSDS